MDKTQHGERQESAQTGGRRPARWRAALRRWAWVAFFPAAGAAALASLWPDDLSRGRGFWLCIDHAAFLACVFRLHLGLGLLLVAAIGALGRGRRIAVLGLLGATWCLAPTAMSWWPRSGPAAAGTSPRITVLSLNLMYGSTNTERTLAEVRQCSPDVILFQEWTPEAAERIGKRLAGDYPHSAEIARDDAFGQAVFSRLAFEEPVRLYPQDAGFSWSEPQVRIVVSPWPSEDRPTTSTVVIYNVHVLPPVSMHYIGEQRRMVASLAGLAEREIKAGRRAIFAGDFNATAGTAHLRAMERVGLRSALDAAAWGPATTWPRTSRLRFLPGIRLDHLLAGGGLIPTAAGTGRDIGSDHRPVWATWEVPAPLR